ncbi:MAG: ABC transporter substrate-binding protein [Erysipelotrichaceae bacterium]|nr:ABC transporter substrate-binding protein [Erysipelotrichaceae bacterium]
MKKIVTILLSIMMILALAACNSSSTPTPTSETTPEPTEETKVVRIGVLQLLTHDALDAAFDGFKAGLEEAGFVEGKNVVFDFQNPEGDQSNLATMADHLIAEDLDLILAIATPAAQQLVSVNDHTPILATAITDFMGAGLVETNDAPGGLLSGMSDNCPMDAQLNLLLSVKPDVKTLGIIYTSSEVNSEIQANQMHEVCASFGIQTKIVTISDKTMIDDAMHSFVGEVDAIYIPTDNNIASAMGSVDVVARENGIITLCGESNMVSQGGALSLGVNYFTLGQKTAEQAVAILNGANVAEIPVGFDTTGTVYFNSKTLAELGLELPADVTGEDMAQ